MNEKVQVTKSRVITYVVFIFALAIVILNIISLVFPALLLTSVVSAESLINPFELGAWAIPFVLVNLSLLIFGFLYYKKSLPKKIYRYFEFITNFEVSRKTAIIVFSIMIGIYIIFNVGELAHQEIAVWKDWKFIEPIIEKFPSIDEGQRSLRILLMKNFLLFSSQEVFENVKIIPFIGSISLVFLTYFLTVQIAKKRFAGLVAMAILLQSHTFLRYDTAATYSNFWTAFYLVSLYLVYKKWPLSPLAYIASFFSKALTIVFLPMTLFFIFRSYIAKKTKIILTISYVIIFLVVLSTIVFADRQGYGRALTSFEFEEFVAGFTTWAFQLRIDGLVLVFLLPLTIGLFIKSRQGFKEADSILVLIGGILLSAPLLVGFTQFNLQPYRWIPLITFFAIGVGVLLSKISVNRHEN